MLLGTGFARATTKEEGVCEAQRCMTYSIAGLGGSDKTVIPFSFTVDIATCLIARLREGYTGGVRWR